MKKVRSVFSVLLLAAIMLTLCACGKGKAKNDAAYAGVQNLQSLVDYAEKLEKAGDTVHVDYRQFGDLTMGDEYYTDKTTLSGDKVE